MRSFLDIAFKIICTALLFIYFEMGYMWACKGHTVLSVWEGSFFFDHLIPLVPFFILFYMLGYVFVFIPCFVTQNRDDFFWVFTTYFLVLTVSFIIFKFIPIRMDKTIASGFDYFSRLTHFQQKADTSLNNFPSLHVSLNLLSFIVIYRLRPNLAKWLCPVMILIILSPLFVKQHLVIDVIGGLIAGFGGGYFYTRLSARIPKGAVALFSVSLFFIAMMIYTGSDDLHKILKILWKFTGKILGQ